jgi:hypothetical protein
MSRWQAWEALRLLSPDLATTLIDPMALGHMYP